MRPGPARPAAIAALSLWLGGCANGIFDPEGPVAAGNMSITIDALVIMMAIVIPTILLALVMALVVPRVQHQGALPARMGLSPAASRRSSGRSRPWSSCSWAG